MKTLFTDNHVECAHLEQPLECLSDTELELAIQSGRPGALTEESLRIVCAKLGITDRRRIEPDWKLREQKATEATPQPGKRRLSA